MSPSTIPFPPTPGPREQFLSIVARAAGARKLSAAAFCNELGLSWKKLVNHDESQVTRTATLLGLNAKSLEEARSWSHEPLPGVQLRFRGEAFGSRVLMSPTVRGCPSCLCESVTTDAVPLSGQMAMQGHWQLRYNEICLTHGRPLAALWTVTAPLKRFDYAEQLKAIAEDIMNGQLEQRETRITSYDLWLDQRLSTRTEPTWFGKDDTETAATISTLLGTELHRHLAHSSSDSPPARALGFDVASRGTDEILRSLRELASHATGAQDGPKKAFGDLYRWLSQYAFDDTRYDKYRDMMRTVIFETWSIAPNEVILGKALHRRRLHSVTSVAENISRSNRVARQILEYEGIIDRLDKRPDARLVFEATRAAPILARCRRLVRFKEMAKRLGTSEDQFKVLVQQKVIRPALPAEVTKFQWDTADALELLETFAQKAIVIDPEDGEWVGIGIGASRARVTVRDAINAIRAGKLPVGRRSGDSGYAAFKVRQSDMHYLSPERPIDPTLVEFGTEIGLQSDGTIRALYDAGHLQATRLFNPITCRWGLYMMDTDRAAFYERFTTLKLLGKERNIESRKLARKLNNLGIKQFAPDGTKYDRVYLVGDVRNVALD